MSRSYARIACSIWDDDDEFMALSVGAQRTYMMLISQKDVSACGTLPLTIRRWAGRMRAEDRPALHGWLEELQSSQFIRMDLDTEELLIRTFVKWDGGYTNTKRTLAIHGVSKALRSPILRLVLADEMIKLGIKPQFSVSQPVSADEYPIDSPSDSPSDTGSDSSRVVVESVGSSTTTLKPETGNLKPETKRPSSPQAASAFETFWDVYPRKVGKDDARKAFAKATKRAAAEDIISGAGRYSVDPNLPDQQFIPHPSTWLNGGRWSDGPCAPPPRAPTGKPNAATVRNEDSIARIRRLENVGLNNYPQLAIGNDR